MTRGVMTNEELTKLFLDVFDAALRFHFRKPSNLAERLKDLDAACKAAKNSGFWTPPKKKAAAKPKA